MNVLMVGVGARRVGGMWTVAESYMNSKNYNEQVKLKYVSTSTNGSVVHRVLYMIKGYTEIKFSLLTSKIDIVHIHMAERGSTFRKGYVAKWGMNTGKKVIVHLHAGPFMYWYNTLDISKQLKVRSIFSYADRILVLGKYWKSELQTIIPMEKMIVLYNGIQCPQQNPYNSEAKNIVYFGVMRKEKGTYDLLKAIKEVDTQLDSEVKVVLCGNDLAGDMAEKVKEYGLEKRVLMPGWVDKEERLKIFHEAMINVLPSYYEGLSMTILEAMAYGIPVITTDISTMTEILGDKEFLIEPGDYKKLGEKILELANNKELRMDRSEIQYLRAKSVFSEELFIKKTLDIYKEVINE